MQRFFMIASAGLALTLCFQNCSGTAFSGGTSTEASTVTHGTSSSSSTGASAAVTCPQVLCEFNVGQISQITLVGETSTLLGTYELNLVLNLDTAAENLNGTVAFSSGSETLASCTANGSNVQLSSLESALEALQFSTTESAAGPTNLASVVLTFSLSNGVKHSYRVDSNTTSASIEGLAQINGVPLVNQLSQMAFNSSCSTIL